jgi:alkylation response protein AidB-like acyl-CoA dehydrogenase
MTVHTRDLSGIRALVEQLLREHPVGDDRMDRDLRGARFDAGLAFPHHPQGLGGLNLPTEVGPIVEGLFLAAGCRDWKGRNIIGLGMAAPTIVTYGSEVQKQALLRPLFTGEVVWCQLFSEPGAGSDLAALATRAVRDGDGWRVSGQKVWTTLGHVARRGLLLARTEPDVPKHRGLTYFLLDMNSPGVEVRPLRQITGEAEFNEVYLTDVYVPDTDRIGEVGGGWVVAMTTLSNERVSLGANVPPRGSGPIALAMETAAGTVLTSSDVDQLVRVWSRVEAVRLTNLRSATQGGLPGPEGSIAKLTMAETNQAVYALCADLLGENGLFIDDYTQTAPLEAAVHGGTDPVRAWLRSLANSIEGGTSEVQRNIIGERVLGLPAEARVDKDQPWSKVPRS